MSEASKKRKYFDRSGGGSGRGKNSNQKWSRRSINNKPGILLTCETGRERKCSREGIEILNYYFFDGGDEESGKVEGESGGRSDKDEKTEKDKKLTLEDELKLLKSKGRSLESSVFAEYNTSCRGTVLVLCALPNCNLIPTIQTEYMQSKNDININTKSEDTVNTCTSETDNVNNSADSGSVILLEEEKKDKTKIAAKHVEKIEESPGISTVAEFQIKNNNTSSFNPPWDPVSTVRLIMSDIDNDSNKAVPRSRFVTRMIPLQATCFASSEELTLTTKELLDRYLSRTTKSFAIVTKRRHCSSLDRNTVIKIIGEAIIRLVPNCKVQLDKPDVTVMVEICNTLCGISVIENFKDCRNFNLMGAITSS
mmetsp:Transcript_53027/g.60026  ORF Transcript_53027/g.60026 Transcript_53027/m.60026 type:complete len:367 (+) Transcript_53027:78-1178(+)